MDTNNGRAQKEQMPPVSSFVLIRVHSWLFLSATLRLGGCLLRKSRIHSSHNNSIVAPDFSLDLRFMVCITSPLRTTTQRTGSVKGETHGDTTQRPADRLRARGARPLRRPQFRHFSVRDGPGSLVG